MEQDILVLIAAAIAVIFVVLMGTGGLVKAFYRKVDQGRALIINRIGKVSVSFRGGLAFPIIHRAEIMDISLKTVEIDRQGKDGLICRDNIRADIKVTFFVRVNQTQDDVLRVAQSIGCDRASDHDTIEELFAAKFSEALKTVGYNMDFVDLYHKRDEFKDRIIEVIGTDLNGYALEDAAIDYLEQTPVESLDEKNILDAQGIRKITELTTAQHVATNEFENREKKQIKKQDVEAMETILALERQQAEAEARQQREILTINAREKAETERVQAEETQRARVAQLKAEEEVAVTDEAKQRQIAVAAKNRERAIKVETERVEKDRALEAIARERETELQRIDKEKALEVEKKAIADIIRDRVAVDKTVAEEEERIKDLRVVAEAKRSKAETVILAEAEAEQLVVKDVKAAEAAATAAGHWAKQKLVQAEADLEAADRTAKARIREAEGTQATEAAKGLAVARVKEADALATEKVGLADVRVKEADAAAVEKQGFAEAKVKEAFAEAIEKQGLAEATVQEQKLRAQATGDQELGMAKVRVQEAEAVAIEQCGRAEAVAIKDKLNAEAAGLANKAEAMKELDAVGRDHEEFRLKLDKDLQVELKGIAVRQEIAEAQARLLSSALSNTKIDIVGGDGGFFERFVNAVTMGKSLDGLVGKSETAGKLLSEYTSGERSLPGDLKEVFTRSSLSVDDLQKLSVTAVLTKLVAAAGESERPAIEALLERAKELGLDHVLAAPEGENAESDG